MSYVWMALVGFVVGLVARALMPGNQRMGLILTALLGIAGSFVANEAGRWLGWYASGQAAGFIASVVGALLVLWVVSLLRKGGQGGD